MNKADLADPVRTKEWIRFYNEKNITALPINSKDKRSLDALYDLSRELTLPKVENDRKRNINKTTIRFMIVGVPNVGKSTLINAIVGKKQAKTGNRPGITKSNQWLKTKNGMELLDTPGVLWPKIETEKQGRLLAYTGAIKDRLLDLEDLAFYFLKEIYPMYPELFNERYGLTAQMEPLEMMDLIGKKSGKLIRGGEVDYSQVADIIFDDYRNGRIGPMTLEWVQHE